MINLQATRAYYLVSWRSPTRRLSSLEMRRYCLVPLNLTQPSSSGRSTVELCLTRVDGEDVAATTTMTMMLSGSWWDDVVYQHITDPPATSTVYISQRSTSPDTKESTIASWRRRRGRCLADRPHSNPQVSRFFLDFLFMYFQSCPWDKPRVGPGHPSSPLVHLSPFLLFPFFHWLYPIYFFCPSLPFLPE